MKRITTNDDIRFPIRVVKGLDSDVFTIQFYTTSRAVCLTKTNADVEDGIIHLEWTELYPLGTGVMNYTVLIPEADGSYSDDTFNKSISGTTIFYIVSDIIVPDGDEAQELVEVVADLQTQVNANTAKIEELMKVTITSSNWSATALQTPDTRYIISGNLDFDSATEVEVGDNCQIEFTKGSTLGSNVELLINNAEIVAPLTQIFDGTKITGFFHNGQIPVEWFGAKGDGETDDAEAINTTIKYAGKSEVLLSAPIYVIGSTIDINETNANFDSYDGQVEEVVGEEGGKKFLCKGSIYSTSDFTGYTVGNVTVPAMIRLAASNATVRIEGAIVVHADLTNCIGFLHEGYHDNKVYIARVMKARDYIGMWSWLDGTTSYTNQALMNLGTCDGVVYIYAMGTDFECEQICGFNNAFMVSDKYARAYAGVQQASFKFASLTANYGIRVKVGNNDGLIHPTTQGWMNACRIEYNGISGSNESRRFIPTTDATLIKVDSGTTTDHFCQNKIICNSVEPVWYKLIDINRGRGDYFEFLGNFGDCHVVPYRNGVPDDAHLGESAPTLCYNGAYPYTSTNKFINISNCKDFLINNLTPFYPMPYDTIYVHNSSNIVFTNCQAAEYIKNYWYQYVESARRFEKVIFTCSDITDLTSTDITVFEPDSRETDTIAYVESANDIDLTVDRLNIVTTPAYTTKFNVYPLYQVINGVKSQLGYCYDYKGLIASNNALEEALSHVTVDAYTKAETDALLANKADRNGSNQYEFTVKKLGIQNEGAAMVVYDYIYDNKDVFEIYNRNGTLQYLFSGNNDKIATERQLATKANSSDVYSKNEVYTKGEVNNLIPDLPDNIVTDANYVHTDNNFTTTLKNKLDGIASGAEVNVQANWNETNSSSDAYIQNKPTNVSSFTNDAGYLTSESDPTVPSWAKAQNKPTYTASEVGALPDTTTIPSKVSDLTNDLGFVTGSKIYVGTCETAAATPGKVATVETFPLDSNNKPEIGTVVAIKYSNSNSYKTSGTTHTLNVNSTGAFPMYYNNAELVSTTSANTLVAGYKNRYTYYVFNGTQWVWLSSGTDTNTTYTNVALGQGYAVQNNSSASATITATLSSYTLTANGIVSVKFNYDVPANATLNINSKGAKAIYNKDAAITAGVIKAGDTATFIYNTYYRLIAVDSWQDNTGGGGSGEMNVQSDWNETDTSSDAYILNKPTVDSSITGSSQTNAVQGGAIYTALFGKAGYKEYNSKSDMDAAIDVDTGTIGFENDEEKFYVYNSANDEWKPIDETDTQVTYITITRSSSTTTVKYENGTTLTPEEYIALLADHTKYILAIYGGNTYICSKRYTEEVEDGYVESTYLSFDNMSSSGVIKGITLDLQGDDPWVYYFGNYDNAYNNTFYISVNNTSQSISYYLAGWTARSGNILVVNFQKDVQVNTTLNISSTGAKNIYYKGAAIKAGIISAGDTVTFAYWSGRYNVVSIEKYHSTDIANVSSVISSASLATITKTLPSYSTYKVDASVTGTYSTWTTKIELNTAGSNTAPVHTIIIEPQALTGYTGNIVFGNQHLQWKNNDEPDLTAQGRSGFDYMVITIYDVTYAKYEKW